MAAASWLTLAHSAADVSLICGLAPLVRRLHDAGP